MEHSLIAENELGQKLQRWLVLKDAASSAGNEGPAQAQDNGEEKPAIPKHEYQLIQKNIINCKYPSTEVSLL